MAIIKEIRKLPPRIKEIKKEESESELEQEVEQDTDENFSRFMSSGGMTAPVLETGQITTQTTFEEPARQMQRTEPERPIAPYQVAELSVMAAPRRTQTGEMSAPVIRPTGMTMRGNEFESPELASMRGQNQEENYETRIEVESQDIAPKRKKPWEE